MNKKEEFKQLLDKYLDAQASPEEEKRLFTYYEAMQKHKEWDSDLMGDKDVVRKRVFSKILKEIADEERLPTVSFLRKWMIAASGIILLGLCTVLYLNRPSSTNKFHQSAVLPGGNKATLTLADGTEILLDGANEGELARQNNTVIRKAKDGQLVYAPSTESTAISREAFNTISIPRGGQYQLILSDGTKVWLNSMSSLKFPTVFDGKERTVELTGEAYFDVTKKKKQPFVVKVADVNVQVLGTQFNISAYGDEAQIKTTLVEGSVKVAKGESAEVLLPGTQAIVGAGDKIETIAADVDEAIAWKNGFFKFNKRSLKDIMTQLSRWYDIDITYEGHIPEDVYVGTISRNTNLSEVLKTLELSQIKYRIIGKKMIITP